MVSARTVLSIAVVVAALVIAEVEAGTNRGVPWATDNRWAGQLNKGLMRWYHHWQEGRVPQFSKLEYVPTYWGPSKAPQWERRKNEINEQWPEHILSFNEPDIEGQANMDPSWAVDEHMKELQTYANRGVKVSSPQMVYNLDWLQKFMDECKGRGCDISFIALHWYGSWQALDDLKKWVTKVHNRFGLPIWVTEFGVTNKSHPSKGQVEDFQKQAMAWFDTQDYVHRAAWNGGYSIDNPPDGFATPLNALFNGSGKLRQTAYSYLYGDNKKRRTIKGAHRAKAMERRRSMQESHDDDEEEEPQYEGDAVHCDEICEKRNKFLADDDSDM